MADTSAHVLLIDDDPEIRALLTSVLSFAGFSVATAADAAEAHTRLAEASPDAVILDVMMPGQDGFGFLRAFRERDRLTPVLFLTARDALEDRVRGLATGADDYVTKPFSMVEVEARLRALLRRSRLTVPSGTVPSGAAEPPPSLLRCADLELDEQRHTVRRAGKLIDLSPTEFRLLAYLMTNQDRVLSKAQILDRVWQYDFGGDGRVVERFVSNVRRKLDEHGDPLIHTVRGFGYTVRSSHASVGG